MQKYFLTSLALTSCFMTLSCQSTPSLLLQDDSEIIRADKTRETYKKGTSIQSIDQPLLVQAPGKISVLVLPAVKNSEAFELSLPNVQAPSASNATPESDNTKLVKGIFEVQKHLASRQHDIALNKAIMLEAKFPSVYMVKYLTVSCLLSLSKTEEAKNILRQILKEYPDDRDAKTMLAEIGGNSP